MKTLKRIGIVLAALVALLLLTGLFVDGHYAVEREVTINKPKQEVFDYVKYLKNQDNYSVWAKIDPGMKKEYRGEDGTAGFVSAWDSENPDAGKGEQKIVKITDGERIDYEIHFIKPFESTANAYLITSAQSDSVTNVKWGFYGKMNYPMNLMLLVMNMDKMLAPDFENGLKNLKQVLDK